MSELTNLFTSIANSIRVKKGTTAVIPAKNFSTEISGLKVMPVINVSLTGDYASYISAYGAGMDSSGRLIIWGQSNSTIYEHVYFNPHNIGVGVTELGWSVSNYDTSDPIEAVYACTVTGLGDYSEINIILDADNGNGTYDYIRLKVTITAT